MSVRIFGHFEQFSSFSARRAPCSAPSCTPDAWTNGPYMTWVLWILVTIVCTPRGRTDLQAGVEIYHWGYPGFWLILSSQNDPILGPQFYPTVWSIGCPISLCPHGSRTQLQVVHSDIGLRSRLLSCEQLASPWLGKPRVGETPILVILAS